MDMAILIAFCGSIGTAGATAMAAMWRKIEADLTNCHEERKACQAENRQLWRACWRISPDTNGDPAPDDVDEIKSRLLGVDED